LLFVSRTKRVDKLLAHSVIEIYYSELDCASRQEDIYALRDMIDRIIHSKVILKPVTAIPILVRMLPLVTIL
jgi:hypothetical protein